MLLIASIFSTVVSVKSAYSTSDAQKAAVTYSRLFLGMLWAATGCILIATIAENIERTLERWTPKGKVIDAFHKPPGAPYFDWRPNWVALGRVGGQIAIDMS